MTKDFAITAEFVPGKTCELFTVSMLPVSGSARGLVIFLPPLAEEMHKSRRTVALQARALAAEGYHVTLMDLPGCGDSGGEFVDATWDAWKTEACQLAARKADELGLPVTLWGLRLGALLACDVAPELDKLQQLLLWQPALNGEQHIDQFLRFELAGQALKGNKRYDRSDLWEQLRTGGSLAVAGYELSSALALQIAAVRLADLTPAAPVAWLDVGAENAAASPAIANVLSGWREREVQVEWKSVPGQHFWRNVDAGESPDLIAATIEALL